MQKHWPQKHAMQTEIFQIYSSTNMDCLFIILHSVMFCCHPHLHLSAPNF